MATSSAVILQFPRRPDHEFDASPSSLHGVDEIDGVRVVAWTQIERQDEMAAQVAAVVRSVPQHVAARCASGLGLPVNSRSLLVDECQQLCENVLLGAGAVMQRVRTEARRDLALSYTVIAAGPTSLVILQPESTLVGDAYEAVLALEELRGAGLDLLPALADGGGALLPHCPEQDEAARAGTPLLAVSHALRLLVAEQVGQYGGLDHLAEILAPADVLEDATASLLVGDVLVLAHRSVSDRSTWGALAADWGVERLRTQALGGTFDVILRDILGHSA